ncbi:MAG TPA: pyrimidine reductase family protein [Galbitalea sp.]
MSEVAVIESLLPAFGADLTDDAIGAHYLAGSNAAARWLRVNFISSIDGAATIDGRSGGLGDDADHRVFDILRRLSDVVLVGAGTVRTEGYGPIVVDDDGMTARVTAGLKPQPTFAIVSGTLNLDPKSTIFTKSPVRPIIVTTASAPASRRELLEHLADVVVCGGDTVDPAVAVDALADRGLTRIHCEGGPQLFGSLLAADVVDEVCLTISPQFVGGDAVRIVNRDLPALRGFTLAGILRSDNTLLLRYLRGTEDAVS